MDLYDRVPNLGYCAQEGTRARGIARGVYDHGVHLAVMGGVQSVDYLALDVGVEDLHLNMQLSGVVPNMLVNLVKGGGAENLDLGLAPHVHPRALDNQDLGHWASSEAVIRLLELTLFH